MHALINELHSHSRAWVCMHARAVIVSHPWSKRHPLSNNIIALTRIDSSSIAATAVTGSSSMRACVSELLINCSLELVLSWRPKRRNCGLVWFELLTHTWIKIDFLACLAPLTTHTHQFIDLVGFSLNLVPQPLYSFVHNPRWLTNDCAATAVPGRVTGLAMRMWVTPSPMEAIL